MTTTPSKKTIGNHGEDLAITFLQEKGYTILRRNYFCRWGEIDIIAKKMDKISFIEVKTRMSDFRGKPYEGVHLRKLSHLKRPIQYFLLQTKLNNYKYSLDVISILLSPMYTIEKLDYYENLDFSL